MVASHWVAQLLLFVSQPCRKVQPCLPPLPPAACMQEHVARMTTMFGHGQRVVFEGKSKVGGGGWAIAHIVLSWLLGAWNCG